MHFEPGNLYHLYNRGNERQRIFFNRENYLFFLKKVRNEWLSYTDILSYCLMPNHFHFIISPNCLACKNVVLKEKQTHMQNLSKAIGKTLSSYTQAINLERERTGNLFQKKTKAKALTHVNPAYTGQSLINCCWYIHSNPSMAGLVKKIEDWEFSSYRDYIGVRNGTLCNKKLFYELSGLTRLDFKRKIDLSIEEIEGLF